MEMERRQAGLVGEAFDREILIDVPINQRKRAIDPGFVTVCVHAPFLPERTPSIHRYCTMFLAGLCDGVPLQGSKASKPPFT